MSTVKTDELFARARAVAKGDPLLTALLDSTVAEVTAQAMQIEKKSADPPTPTEPASPPTPQPETPATPSAELTDAEAEKIATHLMDKHLRSLIRDEMQQYQASVGQAATKATEPQTAKLESIEQTVVALKASFDKLAGVQPAGEAYRASQAADTIVNPALKADPADDPAVAEAKAILAEANRIRGFVWGNNGGQH